MAGSFAFHKLVINASNSIQSKWRSTVQESTTRGPGIGEVVSQMETLTGLFERERQLLGQLIYTKSNQLKNSKYWQRTRQVNVRLKAINLLSTTSILQALHLKLMHVHETNSTSKRFAEPKYLIR